LIIVQLTGGLGNQMFQYAMGRVLAIENKVELKLDLSFFKNYEWHAYSLSPFSIQETFATESECDYLRQKHVSIVNRVLRKTIRKGNYVAYEKNLLYDVAYKKITSPAYLVGYWQCQKYFKEHEALIREEFKLKVPPSTANKELLQEIESGNAVSLHIRRGNFVNVPVVNAVHGTSSLAYYEEAMKYISERVTDPVFYVFSDDIAWAKANLTGSRKFVFIEGNDAAHDYEDFRLMQRCKHHIIANSTFSWWAAWLNPSPGKMVIAPRQWFADVEKNKEASDIVPERWIRL
jgi:hypothetical protein